MSFPPPVRVPLLLVFVSVFAPSAVRADTLPAGVAFVSPPQAIAVSAVSDEITIQLQDAEHGSLKAPGTACAALSSSSASGEFSSNASDWKEVSVLTIAKNSANRNFYYKDGAAGAYTLRAAVALKPEGESRSCANWPLSEWPSPMRAEQSITVGAPAPAPTPASSEPALPEQGAAASPQSAAPPPSGGAGGAAPPVMTITAYASVPEKGAAGAPLLFEARASGLKGEPFPNARFVWSFGDGGFAEGRGVRHVYHYPGAYVVVVEASSGELRGMDRGDIVISAPSISIARVGEGPAGFIELANSGANEIDLSFWLLESSAESFVVPKGTILAAGARVAFPSEITKLSASRNEAVLRYPNGTLAVRYDPKEEMQEVAAPSALAPQSPPRSGGEEKPSAKPVSVKVPAATLLSDSAVATGALLAAPAASPAGGMLPWLFAGALIVVGAVGYMLSARISPPEPSAAEGLKREADEFEIVE